MIPKPASGAFHGSPGAGYGIFDLSPIGTERLSSYAQAVVAVETYACIIEIWDLSVLDSVQGES